MPFEVRQVMLQKNTNAKIPRHLRRTSSLYRVLATLQSCNFFPLKCTRLERKMHSPTCRKLLKTREKWQDTASLSMQKDICQIALTDENSTT